jgi:hypothetical protein
MLLVDGGDARIASRKTRVAFRSGLAALVITYAKGVAHLR